MVYNANDLDRLARFIAAGLKRSFQNPAQYDEVKLARALLDFAHTIIDGARRP